MDEYLNDCPKCRRPMTTGFASRATGLPIAEMVKIEQFAFIEEDVTRAGWRHLLPHKAEYMQVAVCKECEIYLADYSTLYSKQEARKLYRDSALK